jgi:hypothetical protein
MTNLVFIHAIKHEAFAEVMTRIPELIHMLNRSNSIMILGRGCPKLIQTRWVYLEDVPGFIIIHLPAVQTASQLAEQPLVS